MKTLSLALASLMLAGLAIPSATADDVVIDMPCIAPCLPPCYSPCLPEPCYYLDCTPCTSELCPTPCTTATCPPPCVTCPILPPICLTCTLPECDLSDRACHPEPMLWTCGTTDPGAGGVLGDTLVYASHMGVVGCALVFSETNVVLDATGDTTHYAYLQGTETAAFVLGQTVTFPVSPLKPLMADAQGTVRAEAALACSYLLGPYACAHPGPHPAGTCPADVPSSGGQVGKALAYAEAACSVAEGGAEAAAGHAVDLYRSVGLLAASKVRAAGDHASDAIDGAEEHAANLQDHADDAAGLAKWAAEEWAVATCTFVFGACPA